MTYYIPGSHVPRGCAYIFFKVFYKKKIEWQDCSTFINGIRVVRWFLKIASKCSSGRRGSSQRQRSTLFGMTKSIRRRNHPQVSIAPKFAWKKLCRMIPILVHLCCTFFFFSFFLFFFNLLPLLLPLVQLLFTSSPCLFFARLIVLFMLIIVSLIYYNRQCALLVLDCLSLFHHHRI